MFLIKLKIVCTDLFPRLFHRMQQGITFLGKEIFQSFGKESMKRWLALEIYKQVNIFFFCEKRIFNYDNSRSEFHASPSKRSDDKCMVHLYDEASVPIDSVEVEYVIGKMISGGFISVPVIIKDSEDDYSTGIQASNYLNTSIHQSKVRFPLKMPLSKQCDSCLNRLFNVPVLWW